MSKITDWRTSSFSGADNNECVQIANTLEALRDSKNPRGGELRVSVSSLVKMIKEDDS